MSSQSNVALAARVKRLEIELRTLRGLLVALPALAFLLAASGRPQKTVEAQEFVLKDEQGNVRARLGLSKMTYPRPGAVSSTDARRTDPLDLVDVEPGGQRPRVEEVTASLACLSFMGLGGPPALEQCSSWEDEAQSSLRFRVRRQTQFSITVDATGAVLGLGGIRTKRFPEDRGRIAMGSHREGAWLLLEGPPNRETILDLDGLTILDETGKPPRVFPPHAER